MATLFNNISINFTSLDFATTGGVNFLQGSLFDKIRATITFQTDAVFDMLVFDWGVNSNTKTFPSSPTPSLAYPNPNVLSAFDSTWFKQPNSAGSQRYKLTNMAALGAGSYAASPNAQKQWQNTTDSCTITKINLVDYVITHDFQLTPYILANQVDVDGVPSEALVGYYLANALQYVFSIRIKNTTNNSLVYDLQSDKYVIDNLVINQGNTGWFNEFGDGGAPEYELASVLTDDFTGTGYQVRIKKNSGNFTGNERIVLHVFSVSPTSYLTTEYQDIQTNQLRVELLTNGSIITTNIAADSIVDAGLPQYITLGAILITPSAYTGGFYYLAATIGDVGVAESATDRVNILLKPFTAYEYPLYKDGAFGLSSGVLFNYHESDYPSSVRQADNVDAFLDNLIDASGTLKIARGINFWDTCELSKVTFRIRTNSTIYDEFIYPTPTDTINYSTIKSWLLPSGDILKDITFSVNSIQARTNDTGIYLASSLTIKRNDGGSFVADGYVVSATVLNIDDATPLPVETNLLIAGVTADTITLDPTTSISAGNVGRFLSATLTQGVTVNNYFNPTDSGSFAYKFYNFLYPFRMLNQAGANYFAIAGLFVEVLMDITHTDYFGVVKTSQISYRVTDFTAHNFNNATHDCTGTLALWDTTETTSYSLYAPAELPTRCLATFTGVGLGSDINKLIAVMRYSSSTGSQFDVREFSSLRANAISNFSQASGVTYAPNISIVDFNTVEVRANIDPTDFAETRIEAEIIKDVANQVAMQTQSSGVPNFGCFFIGAGAGSTYYFEDGSSVAGESVSTAGNGLDGSVQTVIFEANDITLTTGFSGDVPAFGDFVNTLDLSKLVNLANFALTNHTGLLSLILPSSSAVSAIFVLENSGVTGTLTVPMSNLGTSVFIRNNANLTGINFTAGSAQPISSLMLNDNNITGTIHIPHTNYNGFLRLHTNPLLTDVTLAVNTNSVPNLEVYGCSLSTIQILNLPNGLDLDFSAWGFFNNGMTSSEVDTILADCDTIADALYVGRSIDIAGTNAAPTGGAGNANVISLVAKGITVIHT